MLSKQPNLKTADNLMRTMFSDRWNLILSLVALLWSVSMIRADSEANGVSISFIRENRAVLENIKAVEAKDRLYRISLQSRIDSTRDPVQKVIWQIIGSFAGNDYRHGCTAAISQLTQARELVAGLDLSQRKAVIQVLENPEFIDFKVATRLPMGYNAYALKKLAKGGADSLAMADQLHGWSDYYSALLSLLYDLSQPLDLCGVCATCINCPLYKFKVVFFNYKALLNQDEFYQKLDFIKSAAIRVRKMARSIERRYDLQ